MPDTNAPNPVLATAALMVGTRLGNMALGLIAIPLLIHFLGGVAFAAWAVLLATAVGFSLLDMGMRSAIIRFLAAPINEGNWVEVKTTLANAWLLLGLSYGLGALAVLWTAGPLALWLRLPDTPLMSSEECVLLVFAAVASRAFLQSGIYVLYAARRFDRVAVVFLAQPLLSNLASIVSAWQYHRLDIALIWYWSAQLLVVSLMVLATHDLCLPTFRRSALKMSKLRELVRYGLATQGQEWSQFVNFQFDKFIIAAWVGLWAVAPYEVANRSVLALRSIPSSGLDTFLPTAVIRQASREEAWVWYLKSTRIAAYGIVAFMLAPLAFAPVFLYAWTGEMGYRGTWAFCALMLGAVTGVLAFPAATLAQAAGYPGMQARAALVSVVLNVPFSVILVHQAGLVGAAIGTAVALVMSSAQLLYSVHRHYERSLGATARMLAGLWPLVAICFAWGVVSNAGFEAWFSQLDAQGRFSRALRYYPALLSVAGYVLCITMLLFVALRRGMLDEEEQRLLGREGPLRRLGELWRKRGVRKG